MARMPGAKWQGEHGSRAMDRYDIVCIHTIVGYAPAHAAHFSTKADGTILQSRDTKFRSGANLDGNHRIIAIENEDHGPRFGKWPSEVNAPPLTPEQVEANAQILAWAHKTHGVPLQLCPNSKPSSRGLAYHRQGIDGNFGNFKFPGRVPGGELWTESDGKVCPTDNRIAQRPIILARAIQIVKGIPAEDDDMTPEQMTAWAKSDAGKQALANANAFAWRGPTIQDAFGDLFIEAITQRVKVRRGSRPEDQIPLLQDWADTKTEVLKANVAIAALTKLVASGSKIDEATIRRAVDEAFDARVENADIELILEKTSTLAEEDDNAE